MRISFVVFFLCMFTACSTKEGSPVENHGVADLQNEATGVARRINDLLDAKCKDGYYWGVDGRVFGPLPATEVSVQATPLRDKDRFLGYEWKGTAELMRIGTNRGDSFSIFKRRGKWFIRTS